MVNSFFLSDFFNHFNEIISSTETVRISPFPFALWKTCTQDIQLADLDGKMHHIEKSVEIILPINSYHCHPDYYEQAEKFKPQRFLDGVGDLKTLKEAGACIVEMQDWFCHFLICVEISCVFCLS